MQNFAVGIVAVMVLLLVWIVWRRQHANSALKELLKTGTETQAKIVDVLNGGDTAKNASGIFFYVSLEVALPGTAPVQVKKTLRVSASEAGSVKPGQMVKVMVDPKNLSRVAIPGTDEQSIKVSYS